MGRRADGVRPAWGQCGVDRPAETGQECPPVVGWSTNQDTMAAIAPAVPPEVTDEPETGGRSRAPRGDRPRDGAVSGARRLRRAHHEAGGRGGRPEPGDPPLLLPGQAGDPRQRRGHRHGRPRSPGGDRGPRRPRRPRAPARAPPRVPRGGHREPGVLDRVHRAVGRGAPRPGARAPEPAHLRTRPAAPGGRGRSRDRGRRVPSRRARRGGRGDPGRGRRPLAPAHLRAHPDAARPRRAPRRGGARRLPRSGPAGKRAANIREDDEP